MSTFLLILGEVLNVLTCFIVLYSVCSVDGIAGDGTARGTCPESYLCKADGSCYLPPGTLLTIYN